MRIDTGSLFREKVTSASGRVPDNTKPHRPMGTICNESDEAVLVCEVSDEALEASASPTRDGAAAMSFPNAPTVSILIICCGNG